MSDSKNYWLSDGAKDFHDLKDYKTFEMQPVIDLVKQARPKTLLDYGCGNGLVNTLFDKKIEKTLFDVNLDNFNNLAIDDLNKYNCKIVKEAKDLPTNYFDVVILSFVLVTIPDEKQYMQILQNIRRAKKKNGTLMILDAHPCFMQYDNSYFNAEEKISFPYLSYGVPFKKCITDPHKTKVCFTDYHWPLSFTINKLVESGFNIVRMGEIPDGDFGPYPTNKMYPPIYSMICK